MSQQPGRLDVHLVRVGLARSRERAKELVRRGRVRVEGDWVAKPSYPVPPGARVEVAQEPADRWVGRGALKLEGALRRWAGEGLAVTGRNALDVGASTGGFTQVLLDRGAACVVAVDVGHGQLAAELAEDPRVVDLPGTDIRDLSAQQLGLRFGVAVIDVSFISVTLVLAPVTRLLELGAHVVVLVKPQFEVGREAITRAGVVRSPAQRAAALHRVSAEATRCGFAVCDLIVSPLPGKTGNEEYLLWLAHGAPGMMSPAQVAARITVVTQHADRGRAAPL